MTNTMIEPTCRRSYALALIETQVCDEAEAWRRAARRIPETAQSTTETTPEIGAEMQELADELMAKARAVIAEREAIYGTQPPEIPWLDEAWLKTWQSDHAALWLAACWPDRILALLTERTALLSRLAELERDRERLDWLLSGPTTLVDRAEAVKERWFAAPPNRGMITPEGMRAVLDAAATPEGR